MFSRLENNLYSSNIKTELLLHDFWSCLESFYVVYREKLDKLPEIYLVRFIKVVYFWLWLKGRKQRTRFSKKWWGLYVLSWLFSKNTPLRFWTFTIYFWEPKHFCKADVEIITNKIKFRERNIKRKASIYIRKWK